MSLLCIVLYRLFYLKEKNLSKQYNFNAPKTPKSIRIFRISIIILYLLMVFIVFFTIILNFLKSDRPLFTNASKSLTQEQIEINEYIEELNNGLPKIYGNTGELINIETIGDTIIFNMKEKGYIPDLVNYYSEHYEQIKSTLKFFFLLEFSDVYKLKSVLERPNSRNYIFQIKIKLPTKNFSWNYPKKEILQLLNINKNEDSPVYYEILAEVVNLYNSQLPLAYVESGNAINISEHDIQKNTHQYPLILKDIELKNRNVEFHYLSSEDGYDIDELEEFSSNRINVERYLRNLCIDPYYQEMMIMFSNLNANVVFIYEGLKSKKNVTIDFNNDLIKKVCPKVSTVF